MNGGGPGAAAPGKPGGGGGGAEPPPPKKSYPRTMFWNNLSFKLAIYQKLADFNIDGV